MKSIILLTVLFFICFNCLGQEQSVKMAEEKPLSSVKLANKNTQLNTVGLKVYDSDTIPNYKGKPYNISTGRGNKFILDSTSTYGTLMVGDVYTSEMELHVIGNGLTSGKIKFIEQNIPLDTIKRDIIPAYLHGVIMKDTIVYIDGGWRKGYSFYPDSEKLLIIEDNDGLFRKDITVWQNIGSIPIYPKKQIRKKHKK